VSLIFTKHLLPSFFSLPLVAFSLSPLLLSLLGLDFFFLHSDSPWVSFRIYTRIGLFMFPPTLLCLGPFPRHRKTRPPPPVLADYRTRVPPCSLRRMLRELVFKWIVSSRLKYLATTSLLCKFLVRIPAC